MELTYWSCPLHGIVVIIAKTVLVKMVVGFSNIRFGWVPQVGHWAQNDQNVLCRNQCVSGNVQLKFDKLIAFVIAENYSLCLLAQ